MPPPHRLRTRAVSGLTPPCCYTQIRALSYLAEASESEQSESELSLNDRCIRNVTDFFGGHLGSKGTRHAEDQNVLDALLTAVVDGDMLKDRLIDAVAKLLGANWHAVKRAVLTRLKLDDEMHECTDGVWTRRQREVRSDKYKLPGFYAFCHDDRFFRFSSRRSEPLRNHIGVGEYEIHWAREVPNMMADVITLYRNDDRAKKYRDMDMAVNGGNLPEDTVLHQNICFCLVKPTCVRWDSSSVLSRSRCLVRRFVCCSPEARAHDSRP